MEFVKFRGYAGRQHGLLRRVTASLLKPRPYLQEERIGEQRFVEGRPDFSDGVDDRVVLPRDDLGVAVLPRLRD